MQWHGDNGDSAAETIPACGWWHTLATDHWSLILSSQGTPGTGPHMVTSEQCPASLVARAHIMPLFWWNNGRAQVEAS